MDVDQKFQEVIRKMKAFLDSDYCDNKAPEAVQLKQRVLIVEEEELVKKSTRPSFDFLLPKPGCNGWSSESEQQKINEKNLNVTRYKTEQCHSFSEHGFCRYGDKCQFAHGEYDLRPVTRHPRYKTEKCRTFHDKGCCDYGLRCNFIHNESEVSPLQSIGLGAGKMSAQLAMGSGTLDGGSSLFVCEQPAMISGVLENWSLNANLEQPAMSCESLESWSLAFPAPVVGEQPSTNSGSVESWSAVFPSPYDGEPGAVTWYTGFRSSIESDSGRGSLIESPTPSPSDLYDAASTQFFPGDFVWPSDTMTAETTTIWLHPFVNDYFQGW